MKRDERRESLRYEPGRDRRENSEAAHRGGAGIDKGRF